MCKVTFYKIDVAYFCDDPEYEVVEDIAEFETAEEAFEFAKTYSGPWDPEYVGVTVGDRFSYVSPLDTYENWKAKNVGWLF